MIISISGTIGSGKNTIADYLIDKYNFKGLSFAESLKDALSVIFGWDREKLEGLTVESRKWREETDQWWAERLNIPNFSPRFAMQNFGTEVCRNHFHDEIWIASLERKILNATNNYVVTDCRFANEFNSIKRLNGITLRVEKTPRPIWYQYTNPLNLEKLKDFNIHASEYSSVNLPYDHIIENNSTIENLYLKIDELINL